jgi:hypothetical protein
MFTLLASRFVFKFGSGFGFTNPAARRKIAIDMPSLERPTEARTKNLEPNLNTN